MHVKGMLLLPVVVSTQQDSLIQLAHSREAANGESAHLEVFAIGITTH